jgi:hypothetical protein
MSFLFANRKTKFVVGEGNLTPFHGRKCHHASLGFSSPGNLENPFSWEGNHEIRDHPARDNAGR